CRACALSSIGICRPVHDPPRDQGRRARPGRGALALGYPPRRGCAVRVDRLIAQLDRDGERAPRRAVEALIDLGREALVPLQAAARQGPVRARRWALEALGGLGATEAWPILRAALHDPSMSVRLHGVRAVERAQNPRLARELLRL